MRLPKFEYFTPKTLNEALALLKEQEEGAYIMAGGTDIVVKMLHGRLRPKSVIALQEIDGINKISFSPQEGLTIGATARIVNILSHPDILQYYPALTDAVKVMANIEVRNMGTVVGNLCNAAPSADTAPPLITMGSVVVLTSLEGERRLSLDEFFKGPGITAMNQGEIMTSVFVPLPQPRSGGSYKRISARCGVDIAPASAGTMAVFRDEICSDVKLVLGAVAPIPLRAYRTENLLRGKQWTHELIQDAGYEAAEESMPISDCRASAEWRKKMVAVLTRRTLVEAYERSRKN